MPNDPKPSVVFLLDTLTDIRFLEAFSDMFDLTLVTPGSLKQIAPNEKDLPMTHVVLEGGRLAFVIKAARWLVTNRSRYQVVLVMDNLTAATASNLAKAVTRRPNALILGRPTVDYYSCKKDTSMGRARYWSGLIAVKAMVRFNEWFASLNLPVTHHMVSQMKARHIKMVPWYGVDTRAFARHWTKEQARADLDLPADKQILFCRSRIAPEKDPATFLSAARRLIEEGRPVVALYVGGEYEEFLAYAAGFDVPVIARDHVHPLLELPKYYCAVDVSVQTSKQEGLALSTLEALACEVPMVATAVGGMLETIRPHDTGLNAPVGDVGALAEAISFMLDHPSDALGMARRGREMVVSLFDSRLAFEGYAQAVAQLLTQ